MRIVKVKYVKNIERSIKHHVKQGYKLYSIHQSNKLEMKFYLSHPVNCDVCLVRQYWDEFYPEIADEDFGMPDPFVEIQTKSTKEFKELYAKLVADGIVESVPEDNLKGIAVVKSKDSRLLLVNPDGYTWE